MRAMMRRLGSRFLDSWSVVREPLPASGMHRLVGIALRCLCVSAWIVYPGLLAILAGVLFVFWIVAQAFAPFAIVELILGAALLLAAAFALTAASIGTNIIDRRWRTAPAQVKPMLLLVAGAWLLPAFVLGGWHTEAISDEHHWTVHILALGYVPVLPAVATIVLALIWRPPATASSSKATTE